MRGMRESSREGVKQTVIVLCDSSYSTNPIFREALLFRGRVAAAPRVEIPEYLEQAWVLESGNW